MHTGDSDKKDFDKEAATWDEDPGRVKLANDVGDAMIRELRPSPDQDALDYGCGTGLVTLRLQPFVKTVTGVDSSPGMLSVIEEKVRKAGIRNVRTRFVDFERGGTVDGGFHLIVSSMTLHHVHDPRPLFREFLRLLHPGGTLGVADLDAEDGSFHRDNTGVVHFGFDRGRLASLLRETGFRDIRDATAATVTKEIPGKGSKTFSVFLLIARRSAVLSGSNAGT